MHRTLNGLAPNYIEGLSILGGEPLDPQNRDTVYDLIKTAKELYPGKRVWLFTGYTSEELIKARETNLALKNILKEVDVLKNEPFNRLLIHPFYRRVTDESKKNKSIPYLPIDKVVK